MVILEKHRLDSALHKQTHLPFKAIEQLRDIAYSIAVEPEKVEFINQVVGIIESRDDHECGTLGKEV